MQVTSDSGNGNWCSQQGVGSNRDLNLTFAPVASCSFSIVCKSEASKRDVGRWTSPANVRLVASLAKGLDLWATRLPLDSRLPVFHHEKVHQKYGQWNGPTFRYGVGFLGCPPEALFFGGG